MYEYVYCRLSRKDRSLQISLNLSRELDLTAIYLVVVYNCRKSNKRLCMARGTLIHRHLYMYRLTVITIRLWGTDVTFVIQRTKVGSLCRGKWNLCHFDPAQFWDHRWVVAQKCSPKTNGRWIRFLSDSLFYQFWEGIRGITINDIEHIMSQYADDTLLILDGTEIALREAISEINLFYRMSGLQMNLSKTQIAWIGSLKYMYNDDRLCPDLSFQWTTRFTLLGVIFDVDLSRVNFLN